MVTPSRQTTPQPPPATRLLLQEMHHRVSNSLQLVSSILQLQATRSGNPEVRQALSEAAGRIVAVASLHRRLHRENGPDQIDAAQHLEDLVAALRTSVLDRTKERTIALEAPESLMLSSADLGRIGLIVNELVTNALKYGEGRVVIRVQPSAEGIELITDDEGEGFPSDFAPAKSGGFGMRLIGALAMRGPMSITVDRSVPFSRIVVQVAAEIVTAPCPPT
jgi:two-component system, sensor histidine kinase PdtaS